MDFLNVRGGILKCGALRHKLTERAAVA